MAYTAEDLNRMREAIAITLPESPNCELIVERRLVTSMAANLRPEDLERCADVFCQKVVDDFNERGANNNAGVEFSIWDPWIKAPNGPRYMIWTPPQNEFDWLCKRGKMSRVRKTVGPSYLP